MTFVKNIQKCEVLKTDIRIRGGGWKLLAPEIEDEFLALMPYVIVQMDGDVIVGVEDDVDARNAPPIEPVPEPSDPIADLEELVIDHEYRLTLMELGVN